MSMDLDISGGQPPLGRTGPMREFPLSEKDYRYLAKVVYELSGIVLGPSKVNMVYSRLSRRLRELRLPSFRAYCELLRGPDSADEIGALINAITTNLTRFFREPHHFVHLRQELAQSAHASDRVRIWSAGCSSGEEPYSIAITLADALPDLQQRDVRVLATDLDTNMVATAQAGIYPAASLEEVSKQVRTSFFEHVARGRDAASFRVMDPIRRIITFKQLNLMHDWPIKGPFDVIFCRNVMIYFDGPTKNALVQRFVNLLKPGGYLYIGHSETLLASELNLRLAGPTIYRKTTS